MTVVRLQNIDGVIWNIEQKIIEIIKNYQASGEVTITLCNEGPDSNILGLYKILDLICNEFQFDKTKITIQTGNLLEKHANYSIEIDRARKATEYDRGQNVIKKINFGHKRKNITKHFGLFIGRSNWKRLYLSAIVYSQYQQKTIQTFHYDSKSDFHKTHLGLEKLLHIKGHSVIKVVESLLLNSPLTLHSVTAYPIISPENYNLIHEYNNFFVDIVCETFSTGNTFFPTEKIWRPILAKTPFMVQGPAGFLSNLKKLGFKTFDRWWDESYDEDDEQVAMDTILRNIKKISECSIDELNKIYNDMEEVLKHNYNTFISLSDNNFKFLYE